MYKDSKIKTLKAHYVVKKDSIQTRLKEFEETYKKGDESIFEELCFCIFTAGASARMGLSSIEAIKDIILKGNVEELTARISNIHLYPEARSRYIVHTRNYIDEQLHFRLKEKIESFLDRNELRDFFAANKGIKGLGYKEASHFLRNIGIRGYAILDKHILKSMYEFGVARNLIKPVEEKGKLKFISPSNRRLYMEVEAELKKFSEEIEIDFDELDLLLWSEKTGEILK